MTALKLLGLTTALLALQQLAVGALPEAIRPDFLLVLALALGLRAQAISSLCVAFAIGLGVDILSGAPTGTYALLRGSACALTRLADRSLYLRAPVPWGIYAAVYQGIDLVILCAIGAVLLPDASPNWAGLLGRAPGAMAATGIVAVPLAAWLKRWGLTSHEEKGTALWVPGRSRA